MTDQTQAVPRTFIRYNLERVDYSVTEDELNSLGAGSQNTWREFFLVTASIAIPCLTNAIATTHSPFEWSLWLFLNYLIGGICFVAAVICGIWWRSTSKSIANLIQGIREKPKLSIQVIPESGSSSTMLVGKPQGDIKNA